MDVIKEKVFVSVQAEVGNAEIVELTMPELQTTVKNLKDGVMLEIYLGGERTEKP